MRVIIMMITIKQIFIADRVLGHYPTGFPPTRIAQTIMAVSNAPQISHKPTPNNDKKFMRFMLEPLNNWRFHRRFGSDAVGIVPKIPIGWKCRYISCIATMLDLRARCIIICWIKILNHEPMGLPVSRIFAINIKIIQSRITLRP